MAETDLERLDSLRRQGILSEEAYWDARSRLFASPSAPRPNTAARGEASVPPRAATQAASYPSPRPLPYGSWLPPVVSTEGVPAGQQGGQHKKPQNRRGLLVGVVIVVAVVAAAAVTFFSLRTSQESPVAIAGTFVLTDDATAAADCVGQGVDARVGKGSTVTLSGPDGNPLDHVNLSNGRAAQGLCRYTFRFVSVTPNLSSYTIRVPGAPMQTISKADMVSNSWKVEFRAGPPTTDITGTLDLQDFDTASQDCVGTGGYDDITAGANVVVKDQTGRILGSGQLDEGTSTDALTCSYPFTVADVRQDEQQYTIEISHRGGITESFTELQDAGWSFSLTLGD